MALKILLADDSMTAQNMGKKILTDAGYEVVAVSNGAAAVKKIAEINPHLCILDIYMPGYTGLEVCEKIKSSSVTARMPVLLTVGKMEPYKPEEGARVRADGVIVKPFEASELLRAVHRFSQRIANVAQSPRPAGAPAPSATPPTPPPPPASTPATYERTVKLTREQIQGYMEPGLQGWRGGTAAPETVSSPAARTEAPVDLPKGPDFPVEGVVASIKTASTADAMPAFTISEADLPAAVAELSSVAVEAAPVPAETVAVETVPAPVDVAAATEVAPTAIEIPAAKPAVPEIPPASMESAAEAPEAVAEAPVASAAAVLPGFVDYLIAQSTVVSAPSVEIASETSVPSAEPSAEAAAPPETPAPAIEAVPAPVESSEFAVSAPAEPVHVPVEHASAAEVPVEPAILQTAEGVLPTGAGLLSEDIRAAHEIGHQIPAVDPALEVAQDVAVTATPDPHLEATEEIKVANATEEGLQPTSRLSESEGVVTTSDPNLAPMEGLSDAVLPLEGGRLVVEKPEAVPEAVAEVVATETPAEPVAEVAATEAPVAEPVAETTAPEAVVEPQAAPAAEIPMVEAPVVEAVVVEPPAPVVEAPVVEPAPKPGKKGRKGMRAIPTEAHPPAPEVARAPEVVPAPEVPAAPIEAAAPAAAVEEKKDAAPAEQSHEAPAPKADVTEEIAAVLDLLGQTTASLTHTGSGQAYAAAAATEEAPAVVIGAARVWMAEEVALSDLEATISLENEMRIALAAKEVALEAIAPVAVAEPVAAVETAPQPEAAIAAPAEDTVRDDKHAPKPAVNPDTGAPPPEPGASPTQELAAAMAAAFGGALPQEDLARAEETQSISEEVRRFALGEAYKPKPTTGFGGAAFQEPGEKTVSQAKLAAAIGRALDRLKPQLVAEILKELEADEQQ